MLYSYEVDAQDKAEGVLKMHRRVTSKDVEDYASHIPGDVVASDKEEDIVYKKGVLTHSAGVSTIKMMPHNMVVYSCSVALYKPKSTPFDNA